MPPFTPLFIDGKEVPASDGATFEVHNTSVGLVGTSASASSADCNAAVEAAGRAFKTWEKTTPYARRDIFLKAAELVESDRWRELIVKTLIEETGCTHSWAVGCAVSAPIIRTIASFANDLTSANQRQADLRSHGRNIAASITS